MKRYVCIHCHFYQPARDNAWLEAIERQDSADPYHDWNERITAECYAPNAASRILDDRGLISKIVNNYARISFNFGPTLLSWMILRAPETWNAILAADRESRRRFGGHGSAIAQVYGHVILPLASRRDKDTQVEWGVRDFRLRFGREPEGMWLPETAVDTESLETLARHGIAFTILAQHQAARFRAIGAKTWTETTGGSIDPTRAYLVRLPSGRSISVFFYDGPISRAVAFERLLERGERFAARLRRAFRDDDAPQLVHVATDGETYGHHHRFGDMALSWVLDDFERDPDITLTNYGEFLELHPPAHEVEIHERSSWSCVHGIERWRSDCGCATGGAEGWDQQWRAPLRDAFDWLRDSITLPWENEAKRLFFDPWKARNAYVELVNDRDETAATAFLRRYAISNLTEQDEVRALELLELQRWAMLMYTSCGWFFSDVSGIETVQVIQYAARVAQLAERLFRSPFETGLLERLREARSNLVEHHDGRQIYDAWVRPASVDLERVAAHSAIVALFHVEAESDAHVQAFRVNRREMHTLESGHAKLILGSVHVESVITREAGDFQVAALHLGDVKISCGVRRQPQDTSRTLEQLVASVGVPFHEGDIPRVVRTLQEPFGDLPFSVRSLFRDEQHRVLGILWEATVAEAESAYRLLHQRYRPLVRLHANLNMPLPLVLRITTEATLDLSLGNALSKDDVPAGEVERLLEEARHPGIRLDGVRLGWAFEQTLARLVSRVDAGGGEPLRRLETAVRILPHLPFGVNLWRVQNRVYELMVETEGDARALQPEDAQRLHAIAAVLNVFPASLATSPGFHEAIGSHRDV